MMKYIFRRKFEEDSSEEDETKIRFKHTPLVDNMNLNEINYLASEHFKGLQ